MTGEEKEGRLREELLAAEAAEQFPQFLVYINPQYDMQWFHYVIARHCQAALEGKIRKLMVFVPPQHGKSEIISRTFPAWALGRNPDLKIVGCSYSADLAQQFSRAIQRIIAGDGYRALFPGTVIGEQGYVHNVDMFETGAGRSGFYKAVGVGGSLTGTPADIAIIDDPVKDAAEAFSPVYRARVWEWYNTVLSTRLHNESRVILIMTRWHEDDLAGRILRSEGGEWRVLSIPALCEVDEDGGFSTRKVGDPLWGQKHSTEKLLKQKERAPREFAALYQQRPSVEGGNIVQRTWFGRISQAGFRAIRFREPIHFYLDTGYGRRQPGKDNDPSGILAACMVRGTVYLVHAQRVWKEMPELLRFLPEYMQSHGGTAASRLCVEPKANGLSVVQMLKAQTTLNVRKTPTPTDSKETRLRVVSPRIECGRVAVVDGDWTEDFLDEVCGFPAMPHDEFVDILGYAINDLFEQAADDGIDYDNLDTGMFR